MIMPIALPLQIIHAQAMQQNQQLALLALGVQGQALLAQALQAIHLLEQSQ